MVGNFFFVYIHISNFEICSLLTKMGRSRHASDVDTESDDLSNPVLNTRLVSDHLLVINQK